MQTYCQDLLFYGTKNIVVSNNERNLSYISCCVL